MEGYLETTAEFRVRWSSDEVCSVCLLKGEQLRNSIYIFASCLHTHPKKQQSCSFKTKTSTPEQMWSTVFISAHQPPAALAELQKNTPPVRLWRVTIQNSASLGAPPSCVDDIQQWDLQQMLSRKTRASHKKQSELKMLPLVLALKNMF